MGTSPIRSGSVRAAVAVSSILIGLGVIAAPAGAAEGDPAQPAITVTQTPSGAGGPCVPAPLGLSYTTVNDAESFTLRVTAAAPPCSPIEAKAVVYAMPGNGEAWPQTLAEVVPFTISEAGLTEIVFDKACGPVQFDVLTGATPPVIAPLGAWHGPLLFPFDTTTALQYWGDPSCSPNSSSTSTTSSSVPQVNASTTVPVSSSAPPPEVESITTVPGSAPVQVAGATQEPAELALTGSGTGPGALLGGGLIALGAALLVLSRRRPAAEA